jgi:hypothetical protein
MKHKRSRKDTLWYIIVAALIFAMTASSIYMLLHIACTAVFGTHGECSLANIL